ncbi:hypothetical protein HOF56_05165 [Candidatus Peribacteria bacterium]|jgi:hypothetical protein|nr:hypothetical protein [Candidatus Peribacteria bacterium]MBT4021627.1 hypothetical protein [Candidatus Peribacteria bacterium]MBT4240727.1 hypothetical protein [Candidatus Peribacteria bacterium]MBT4474002.1 hypothetical protein [Candidatus Peribacteria bacterium]
MTHLKRIPSSLAFGATYFYLTASNVFAAFGGTNPELTGLADPGTGGAGVRTAVINVLNIVLNFLALIAVVFVIVGGFRILTAGGNEENVTKGRKTIIYAIIGLVIIFFARVIVGFFTAVITTTSLP